MNKIVILNKPKGITSQQAVTRVKRLFKAKKAGHSGTLDPMATGVLIVCLDEATKIMRFLVDKDKRYRAEIRLGIKTDTQDAEGNVIETKDIPTLTFEDVEFAIKKFVGKILQTPPMYSAIKVNGTPLYKMARKGIEVERQARLVEIYDIRLIKMNLPYIEIDVNCSKGTYIRTLCEDIGRELNTCAHLAGLERTTVGSISLDKAISLGLLEKNPLSCESGLLSIDDVLQDMQELTCNEIEYARALHGVSVEIENVLNSPDNSYIKLKSPEGKLFGIGSINNTKIMIQRILKI